MENNFTTARYSSYLIDLGLPVDTADCYYNKLGALSVIPEYSNFSNFCDKTDIPCWSVGRLIEIYNKCINDTKDSISIPKNHIVLQEVLIEFFGALQYKWLDFSKLND